MINYSSYLPKIVRLSLFLITFVFLHISDVCAQLDRFEIEFPHDKSVDAFGFDNLGYPWTLDIKDDELEIIKYYGTKKLVSQFPERLAGNYSGEVIFINQQLLVGNGSKVYLYDPSDETYDLLWDLPHGFKYDYSFQDDMGVVWVYISNITSNISQAFRYNVKGKFEYAFDLDESYKKLGTNYSISINDADGKIHFLYELQGLSIINQKGEPQDLQITDLDDYYKKLPCSIFKLDNKNGLWRIYEDKIELLNRVSGKFELHPLTQHLLLTNPCRNLNERLRLRLIFRDSKDRLWIGGEDSQLYLYEEETNRVTFFGKALVDNIGGQSGFIIDLHEDDRGNIWGRKRGGIFKITDKKSLFEKYAVNTQNENHSIYRDYPHINRIIKRYGKWGKSSTSIANVIEDSNNDIYFFDRRFLFKLDPSTKELKILPSEPKSSNLNFFKNDSLKILSTWDQVYALDSDFRISKKLFSFKKIENIFQQANGDLWISGYKDENYKPIFAKIDPSTLLFEGAYEANGITLSDLGVVKSMTEDADGNLWINNSVNLFRINASNGLIIPQESEFLYNGKPVEIAFGPETRIRHIGDNLLGIRSQNCLAIINLKSNEVIEYTTYQSFGAKDIDAAYIDKESAWFGHNKKISNYNFNSKELIHFSARDGLDIREAVRKFRQLSNGKLAVSTFNGLYIFHPDSLISNYKKVIAVSKNTPIKLESYSILDGKKDSIFTSNYYLNDNNQPIELSHNDKMLDLNFSLLNFDKVNDHHISSWLEGYDNRWSMPTRSNSIRYMSLPPGEYNLKVRLHSGNGIWSEKIENIPIIVYAPWYKRWWSYMIFGLIIFGGLYGIYRYQINQILKYEKLRTKISSDLHDDVGTLLTALAMQSEVLGLDAPLEKTSKFEKFSALSREAMDRMRDTVWAIDSRKDNMVSLIDRMGDYIGDIGEDGPLKMTFEHDVRKLSSSLAPDVRQNIYLIFKEALNNALKYSNGNQINIKLKQASDSLSLSIKDNGTKSQIKTSGLGISNMKMRAKRINGDLSLNNNDGFEVLLTLRS